MRRTTLIVASGAGLVGVLLLLWGTSAGQPLFRFPEEILPDFTLPTPDPPPRTLPPPPDATSIPTPDHGPLEPIDVSWLRWVFYGLITAAVIALAAYLVRQLLSRTYEPAAEQAVEELEALLDATSEQRRRQIQIIGEPRNAIVACWVALEDAAEQSGLVRDPAQTSSEFTASVLGRWEVPEHVIRDLGEMYRLARFSEHPMTEQQRDAAVEALTAINERLTAHRAARAADEDVTSAVPPPSAGQGQAGDRDV